MKFVYAFPGMNQRSDAKGQIATVGVCVGVCGGDPQLLNVLIVFARSCPCVTKLDFYFCHTC